MSTDNLQNTVANSDFARVSTTGAVTDPRTDNQQQKPLADQHGRLYTVSIPFTPGFGPTVQQAFSGGVFVTQAVMGASPAQLIGVSGYNADPLNLLYVGLYDKATSLIAGDSPNVIIPVPALSTFSYSLPIEFGLGIVLAISTTALIFTAPPANYLSYMILYRIP